MTFQLSNETISVRVKSKGAELCSLYNFKNSIEYIWQGDEKFWAKHAPVLFPVIGKLKENTFWFEEKKYHLNQHGFARDKEFELISHTGEELSFRLKEDEDSLKIYPFPFELYIHYRIEENKLCTIYEIKNTGINTLYFSIGAHPAFNIPLMQNEKYEDYYLEFSDAETADRYLIEDGLISNRVEKVFEDPYRIFLSKELFHKDALVFKDIRSEKISIRSNTHKHGLSFEFTDFPYFGIWAKQGADFVCLEPWCGIADHINTDQQLKNKEGIQSLQAGEIFTRSFSIESY
jgi:galactose mutarotase-like enzyme